MERALAAIHQAHHLLQPITFLYADVAGRVDFVMQCPDAFEELGTGPIAASYPNCTPAAIENLDAPPAGWSMWSMELSLVPEIFPAVSFPLARATWPEDLRRSFFPFGSGT